MKTRKASERAEHDGISATELARLREGAAVSALPRAFGAAPVTGRLRSRPADFVVDERLSFPLSGEGEHLYLRLRKTGQNTRWVARQLARRVGLPHKAVGFAGLKDRHAVASQWFSLHLPGRPDPTPAQLDIDGVEVVEAMRHSGKLRTGALSGNRFRLVVRRIEGDRDALCERLQRLLTQPVPNYFGAQRFGRGQRNLELLCAPGARPDRDARSFGLSALRSALFNLWLARRVADGTWDELLCGEIGWDRHDGRYTHESTCAARETLWPTGLLLGVGISQSTGDALVAERAFVDEYPETAALLEAFEARTIRRPLCQRLEEFDFDIAGGSLELSFSLARGQFATVAIRELGEFFDAD